MTFFAGAVPRFRLFSPSGYNIPKPKNLFYVNFVTNYLSPNTVSSLNFFVKRMDRLQMTYGITTLNQYNKKRQIQDKITYGPLSFSFHDTTDGTAAKLIQAYNSFYYGDFSGKGNNSWNYDVVGNSFEPAKSWGLTGAVSPGANYFISRIELSEIFDQVYSQINFINPKFESVEMANVASNEATGNEINVSCKYEGVVFQAIAQPVTQALADMWGLPLHNDFLSGLLGGLNIPGLDISSGVGLPGQSLLSSIANVVNNQTNGGTISPTFNTVNSILNGVQPSALSQNTSAQTINGYLGSTIGGGMPTMSLFQPISAVGSVLPDVQNQVDQGQPSRDVSMTSFNVLGPLSSVVNF